MIHPQIRFLMTYYKAITDARDKITSQCVTDPRLYTQTSNENRGFIARLKAALLSHNRKSFCRSLSNVPKMRAPAL